MTQKTKADKVSATAARAWRAQPVRLDPEMSAVLNRAWRASHAAARSASVVVVKRS